MNNLNIRESLERAIGSSRSGRKRRKRRAHRATFGGAGFVSVAAEHFDVLLHFASDEDACGAAFAGGPTALAYSRFPEDVKDEVHAEYLASIERFREGKGYAIPGEFVIAISQKLF